MGGERGQSLRAGSCVSCAVRGAEWAEEGTEPTRTPRPLTSREHRPLRRTENRLVWVFMSDGHSECLVPSLAPSSGSPGVRPRRAPRLWGGTRANHRWLSRPQRLWSPHLLPDNIRFCKCFARLDSPDPLPRLGLPLRRQRHLSESEATPWLGGAHLTFSQLNEGCVGATRAPVGLTV